MSLIAEKIEIQINKKTLITNASIKCQPGEIIALCGPNGAGKSSLLKAISGDMSISQGSIFYNGKNIKQLSSNQLAMHRAVMPQQLTLDFPFTAREVIEMALLFTQSSHEHNEIINNVSGLLSLDEILDRAYPMLSGGEKQRVQLARVIAQLLQENTEQHKYLFLDESTSAMDMTMMHQAFSVIKKVAQLNIGIIAVVHDINLASLYADKIVFIKNKTTAFTGTAKSLITKPIIDDVFSTSVSILEHPTQKQPLVVHAL